MTAILFVCIKSSVAQADLLRRMEQRLPAFRAIPGLIQKIFGRDESSGTYFFEDRAVLDAYRASELAKSIPVAYETTEVRSEICEFTALLDPEQGPATRDEQKVGSLTPQSVETR